MISIYYGEQNCTATTGKGTPCSNKAYYKPQLCGMHCKKDDRIKLSKNKSISDTLINHCLSCVSNGSQVRVTKMRMMKAVDYFDGYINVFPNYRHGKRKDGTFDPETKEKIDCSSLSPFLLGPIEHGEPGFPSAKNIENYWQQSKMFEGDVVDDKVTEKALKQRKYMFTQPGQRHKVKGQKPLFSIFYTRDGKERRFSYFEARPFYCKWYEILAKKTEAFGKLKGLLERGYSLNIYGYDGFYIETGKNVKEEIYEHYNDGSKPFGHELVLFSLLILEDDEYPWLEKTKELDIGN